MRRTSALVAGLVVTVALLGAGCDGDTGTDDGRVGVVASFYPVAAAAERVGGDCVDVVNLTPAGAEPHDLELTPAQVDAIQDAEVVLVMGRGFQPAVEDAADRSAGRTVTVLDRLGIEESGDPHVWLDPERYAQLVDVVASELARHAPACRAAIEERAARYRSEIDAVGAEYAAALETCERRVLVTAHEAFGHLASRYDLRQEGIAGIAPDEEPNARRLAELADLVRDEGITTIFTEELVSRRVADALAREAGGVRTATLNPLEGLTEDEEAAGADWASVMRANLRTIVRALGCS